MHFIKMSTLITHIYIHKCTHTYRYIGILLPRCALSVEAHACMHTYMHIHTCMCILWRCVLLTHTHTYIHTYIQVYRHFIAEMRTLSRIRHPNIITVMGAVIRTKDPMLVMQLCEHGRYVCEYACLCVCMCIYVCAYVCMCMNHRPYAFNGAV
jgi:hypothetical protein